MAKPQTPRTAAARPPADQVDPPVPNTDLTPPENEATASAASPEPSPTDANDEARTAPNDAPPHTNEPSAGASTPRPQDGNALFPDTNTKPDDKAMKAADGEGKEQADDPLLAKDEDDRPIAGAQDEIEAKTTGDFLLMDPFTGKHFDRDTATKTPRTQWVQEQIDAKRLVEA